MDFNSIILNFFLLSFVTSGFMVLLLPNPIHSLLFLIIVFVNASGLLMSFNLEFLSLLLIIIYVGAIAVLFLFMLMMLDIQFTSNLKIDWFVYLIFSLVICILFYFETFSMLFKTFMTLTSPINTLPTLWILNITEIPNCETFGHVLYSYNLLFLLIAGLILLLALLGAIYLTHTPNKVNSNKDFMQLSKNALIYVINKK